MIRETNGAAHGIRQLARRPFSIWPLYACGRVALRALSEGEHRSLLIVVEKRVSRVPGMNGDSFGYGWAASFGLTP